MYLKGFFRCLLCVVKSNFTRLCIKALPVCDLSQRGKKKNKVMEHSTTKIENELNKLKTVTDV